MGIGCKGMWGSRVRIEESTLVLEMWGELDIVLKIGFFISGINWCWFCRSSGVFFIGEGYGI